MNDENVKKTTASHGENRTAQSDKASDAQLMPSPIINKSSDSNNSQLMPSPIVSKTPDTSSTPLMPSPNILSVSSGKSTDTGPSSSTTPSSGTVTSVDSLTAPSSGTVTSVDTVPNSSPELPLSDSKSSVETTPSFWGNMYAMKEEFYNLDMVKDRYTFGRKSDCDYSFDIPSIRRHKYFNHYSKKQFAINRSVNPDGSSIAFLEDLGGTNGTFVNGERVPSKTHRPLMSRDKIGLCYNWNDIFLYILSENGRCNNDELSKKYVVDKRIGAGACGEVYVVWLKHGFGRFACKIIKKSSLTCISAGASNSDVMAEVRILKQLDHPGVIGVHDVIDTPDKLHLVLEYAIGGDLFSRVTRGALPEALAKLYFFQMLHAVMYLHDNGITHRDLKPENILLMSNDEPCVLKITDFGISRLASEKTLMHTLAGTLSYWSPEIVRQLSSQTVGGYTKLVDMWSLGVILYICLVAYPPFAHDRNDTKQDLKDQILSANFNFIPNQWKMVSCVAKDLISQLLKVDIRERFNSNQAMNHAWLKDAEMWGKAAQLVDVKEEVLGLLGDTSTSGGSVDTRKVSTDNDPGRKSSNGSAPLSGYSGVDSREASSSSDSSASTSTVLNLKRSADDIASSEEIPSKLPKFR